MALTLASRSLEASFYGLGLGPGLGLGTYDLGPGLGLGTYDLGPGLGLEGPGLGLCLESCTDTFLGIA